MKDGRENYDYLPELLAEISGIVGLDAALKIARARGGTSTHFPARIKPGHWLAELIGMEPAQILCKEMRVGNQGISLMVPLGPVGTIARMRRKADHMIAAGDSTSQTALATGFTSRSIERRRARARTRRNADQKEMF